MKIKFRATWSQENQAGVKKGILALVPDAEYVHMVGKFLTEAKGKPFEVDMKTGVKERNLDQNALMWSLYRIEAREHNGGREIGEVKPEALYEADLLQHAPRAVMDVDRQTAVAIRAEYRVVAEEPAESGVKMILIMSTSHFTTVQMADWINMIFDRLAENGLEISTSADVASYWKEWRGYLNFSGISLHEDATTLDEYKAATPICEATGEYIGTGGSLAHICARGMGGNPEAWKDTPANWLHLSDKAHAELDNGKGLTEFLRNYPHLKSKIDAAMSRTPEPVGEPEQPEIW
jgi:hypothetical protein